MSSPTDLTCAVEDVYEETITCYAVDVVVSDTMEGEQVGCHVVVRQHDYLSPKSGRWEVQWSWAKEPTEDFLKAISMTEDGFLQKLSEGISKFGRDTGDVFEVYPSRPV